MNEIRLANIWENFIIVENYLTNKFEGVGTKELAYFNYVKNNSKFELLVYISKFFTNDKYFRELFDYSKEEYKYLADQIINNKDNFIEALNISLHGQVYKNVVWDKDSDVIDFTNFVNYTRQVVMFRDNKLGVCVAKVSSHNFERKSVMIHTCYSLPDFNEIKGRLGGFEVPVSKLTLVDINNIK